MKQLLNEITNTTTEEKQQNETIELSDNALNENNPFINIKTDDIYIEDDLFDNKNTTDLMIQEQI